MHTSIQKKKKKDVKYLADLYYKFSKLGVNGANLLTEFSVKFLYIILFHKGIK